jgi:hypothetical protein
VADTNKSREQWKLKAEVASQRLETLEAENAELLTKISALEREKKNGAQAGPSLIASLAD